MQMLEYIYQTPVASLIFAITLAASFYCFQNPHVARNWMLNPYSFVREKRYHTVITSGFIHGDLQHLLFNMITFFFFAFQLEKIMVSLAGVAGHFHFAAIYLISLVLSDVTTIYKHRNNPDYYSLGASGAISAVLFSFILFAPTEKIFLFFVPIGIPSPIFAVLYVAYSIYAGKRGQDNINHEAHLSGAVLGVLLTIIFYPGIISFFLLQLRQIF
jgi:membrane associated rhomboid family serine protease